MLDQNLTIPELEETRYQLAGDYWVKFPNWPEEINEPYVAYCATRGHPAANVVLHAQTEEKLEHAIQAYKRAFHAHYHQIAERQILREELLADELLNGDGSVSIQIDYYGSGDSGGIEDCTLDAQHPLRHRVEELLWNYFPYKGFENNDGGQGDITWDLLEDKITIRHEDNIMTVSETVTEV